MHIGELTLILRRLRGGRGGDRARRKISPEIYSVLLRMSVSGTYVQCATPLRLFVSIWFQVYFTALTGLLFTFPSRY
jgi:hypothetical protein